MKALLSLILGTVILHSPLLAREQADTIYFDGTQSSIPINASIRYFSSPSDMNIDSAWHIIKNSNQIKRNPPINFGIVNGFFWLALTIKNTTNQNQNLYLKIKQPHLYQVYFFQVNRNPEFLYKGGMYFPFNMRPVPVRYFAFPLHCPAGAYYTALIKIHHVNSLSIPAYLETERELLVSNYRQNLGWGFWVGFIFFNSLFALMGWIVIRRSVFFWYFLYMLCVVLFGLTEQGYSFQFVFPDRPEFSTVSIIGTGILLSALMIKFTQSLLETKKYLPWSNRLINAIITLILSMIALGIIAPHFMFRITPWLLPFLNGVMLFSLALVAYIGIQSLKTNRTVALFYLIAYTVIVLCSTFTILDVAFGLFDYFGPNLILLGYLAEALLLSIAIALFFHRINTERLHLSAKVTTQQKEMYQQYISGIEKERSRIAGELHDDVGSRLSFLKRLIQNQQEQSKKAVDQLDVLINDIRKLSHDLAPPIAHISGLAPLLEKLVSDQRKVSGLDLKLQIHNFTDNLSPFQIQQIYRIVQEALSNIINHSKAKQGYVQIFGHEKYLDLMIEDNGKGFEPSTQDGFGLSQMRIRTDSLSGRIEINSHPGKGTIILVQVPFSEPVIDFA
ncbi:MAG: hypothetical protein JST69_02885 [Bacteroidetes bacterium]|nr:hypothetical protein [Bacteroidota bacterium]